MLYYLIEYYNTNKQKNPKDMFFFQTAHLQAEQLQSVHEHAEPQLVFSSIKDTRSKKYELM